PVPDRAWEQAAPTNFHASFSPRSEAPHDALRPARGALDPEAAGLDGGFGVAIGMAAAGQAGPQRLDAVLQPRAPRPRRTDVLHPAELAGGREHPTGLRQDPSPGPPPAKDPA